MKLALELMGVCAFSEFFELKLTLQPKGHVTCKLLNHYFLECTNGGAFTCEIKSTGGLPRLRDSIVFRWVFPPPTRFEQLTFCTFTDR